MDRDFQTQHKLLLLETLYDAGLSLGSLPDEEALVEDVLGRAVGVLDASRGYLATFGEGGARRAEARVGFPRRPSESVEAGGRSGFWCWRTRSSAAGARPRSSRRTRAS